MSCKPWLKFYPRDFLGNSALAKLDRATRQVLVEVLCLAHEQPTYGRISAGSLADYLAGDPFAASAVDLLISRGVLKRDAGTGDLILRRMMRDGQKSADGALARLKRADLAGHSRARAQGQKPEARDQREEIPPSPPSGESPAAPRPTPTPRRTAPDPWQAVLQRPEYEPLRSSPRFTQAWNDWIAHTREAGKKAKEPSGIQAAKILNVALRSSPEQFEAAVEASIAGNWQGIHYPDNRTTRTPQLRQTKLETLDRGAEILHAIRNGVSQP